MKLADNVIEDDFTVYDSKIYTFSDMTLLLLT